MPMAALYSVHFVPGADNNKILGNHGRFLKTPEATHVADIYARLAGVSPILQEDVVNMPVREISLNTERPVLVSVTGGSVSKSFAHPVMLSANTEMGPAIDDVVEVLQEHEIGVESRSFESMDIAKKWIEGQKKPVVILHREEVASKHANRRLANSSNAFMPLSEEEISSYQIFYWTFFVFLVLLLVGVMSIFSMEVIPDSLLFAKFQSSRTGKID